MNNKQLASCIAKDRYNLSPIYAGVITLDDAHNIVKSSENIRQFLCVTLLQRNIRQFPIAYLINTGTHKNGGKHWQGLYFDHQHYAHFFDSYGREPEHAFQELIIQLIRFSYVLQHYRLNLSIENILSRNFFSTAMQSVNRVLSNRTKHFPYQIQSDVSNVCGEYSLLFLYQICRCKYPLIDGYSYWYSKQFTLLNPRDEYTGLNPRQKRLLLQNDIRVRNRVRSIFNYNDSNILA